jgi:hypothetical protein
VDGAQRAEADNKLELVSLLRFLLGRVTPHDDERIDCVPA